MTRPTCTVEGCDTSINARGLCHKHYKRYRKYGDVDQTSDGRSLPDKQYVEWRSTPSDSGCWLWTGSISLQGYGVASRDGRKVMAHRLAYQAFYGPIPEGHDIRHRCDNPPCVNPDHLETGTRADNNRDTSLRGRHGNAKLSNEDVVDIRWAHGLGATGSALARGYGVTPTAISQIVNNRSRRNAR